MIDSFPNLQDERKPRAAPSVQAIESILSAALAAQRAGTVLELFRRYPRVLRRCRERYLDAVMGTAGDALPESQREAMAAALLMRWAVSQIRPDKTPAFTAVERSAWLDRTSWRPALAVLCHYGFEPVADFPDRYRRRADEPAAETMCGLWGVGQSTFYRYLDKGRHLMAVVLAQLPNAGEQRAAMREAVQQEVYRQLALDDRPERQAWHQRQAARSMELCDPPSALWHLCMAADVEAFVQLLARARLELARNDEADALLERLGAQASSAVQRVNVLLAKALLRQARNEEEPERLAYEEALRAAAAAQDDLLLGRVYGRLGKFYEARDTDRSLSCLEDSSEFLLRAGSLGDRRSDAAWRNEYALTLQKLAWLYVQRSDPRARTVLERADAFRGLGLEDETIALLEQAWGEFWRRSGNLQRAIEHQQRVLNVFERLGHLRQILSTYNNLSIIYGEAKQYALAVDYGRKVIEISRRMAVDPYVVAGAHINLGVAHFWQDEYSEAIDHYQAGLEVSLKANLQVYVNRAHYNLAEACYKRFQASRNADDERLGDFHAAAAVRAGRAHSDLLLQEAAKNLKTEILGAHEGLAYGRLLPEEFAAHFDEMAEVQRHRASLVHPLQPEDRIRAHLAIARAYLAIAAKERLAARTLIERFGAGHEFAPELEQLQATFDQKLLGREHMLNTLWREAIGDLLNDERREALLKWLVRGEALSKSIYAQVCGVALATASKHLSLLAERGLVAQTGRGPTTRYSLVDLPSYPA